MSDTLVYRVKNGLYLNITNRCPCACEFCVRQSGEGINQNESLWLSEEPEFQDFKRKLDKTDFSEFDEVVFCGYGEPTERLSLILEIGRYIKSKTKLPLRLNTNGLSDLINAEGTAQIISEVIDRVSISLNAPTSEEYYRLCHPSFGIESFVAVLKFAEDCKKYISEVYFTIVDVLSEGDMQKCREISESLGIPLRVRLLL